jgi:hypothetical protein
MGIMHVDGLFMGTHSERYSWLSKISVAEVALMVVSDKAMSLPLWDLQTPKWFSDRRQKGKDAKKKSRKEMLNCIKSSVS